jgi:hypothetical protein
MNHMVSSDWDRRRRNHSLGRWASMVACGAVAASLAILLLSVTGRPDAFNQSLSELPATVLAFVLVIVVSTVCWISGGRRWTGFFGVKHFWSFPPLWTAAATALVLFIVFACAGSGTTFLRRTGADLAWFFYTTISVWGMAIGAVVIMWLSSHARDGRARGRAPPLPSDTPAPVQKTTDPFEALREWLRTDHEIHRKDDDHFGHDDVARRIARRLVDGAAATSIALIGRPGSGKSTIRRLVVDRLKVQEQVRIVEVSLWPYDSPEAAVRGILRAAIQEIGRHVNVLPLVGLSDDYATAIEGAAGRLGSIARIARGSSDPEETLGRLSAIAEAIGLHLVFWIEDLERFSGHRVAATALSSRPEERLGPIRALLHLLARQEYISVVISDVSLDAGFDLDKIARFISRLWKDIQTLRSACLGGWPRQVIDPAHTKVRETLTPPEDEHALTVWLWSFRDDEPGLQEAIALLVDTPRAFKSALRLTLDIWEQLAGEIDLDSVLVASVLRVSRPAVFAIIDKYSGAFQHGFKDSLSNRRHPALDEFDRAVAADPEKRMQNAIRTVVTFIFPAAREEGVLDREYVSRPQALFVNQHVDYYQRYSSVPEISTEESDVAVISAITAWNIGGTSDIPERVMDSTRQRQVETFVGLFRWEALCRLLRECTAVWMQCTPVRWPDRSYPPGLTSIRRMMQHRRRDEARLRDTVIECVRMSTGTHIPLTWALLQWITEGHSVPSLLGTEQREAVRSVVSEEFMRAFTGPMAADEFANALQGSVPYYAFLQLSQRLKGPEERTGQPFDGWVDVLPTLTMAAERHPVTVLPSLLPFVVREANVTEWSGAEETGSMRRRNVAAFDAKAALRLFSPGLLRVLASTSVPEELDANLASAWIAAREGAQLLLPEHQP